MAGYEAWRTQHDADEWFKEIGFREAKNKKGVRKYYDEHNGNVVDLSFPKYVYSKTIQHGVHLTEGVLEALVQKLDSKEFSEQEKAKFIKLIKEQQNDLNNIKQDLKLRSNN